MGKSSSKKINFIRPLIKVALFICMAIIMEAFGCLTPDVLQAASGINNPALHKSSNLGNKYGNWGDDYVCSTCHSKNITTNIKKKYFYR